MSICAFAGHRHYPESIKDSLYKTIEELVVSGDADRFHLGNQGQLAVMALYALKNLRIKHLNISYCAVLTYVQSVAARITGKRFAPTE